MNPVVRPSWSSRIDPSFLVLLATATALFAAGMSTLSLESLDDAFYARKGVEMARSGGFFTVTWAGQPTFQNPPLQIWFIGQSHSLFGEGDLAARFPSLLMALATLVITNRIGRRLVGRQCALTAVALLLVTPLFVDGARGCMMEMPQVFWVSLAMLIAIEGRDRPNLLLLLALPLGAGILTKSVLDLLPLLVLGAAAWSEEYRRLWRTRQLWTALVFGIILGSLWPVHQALTLGSEAIRAHYLGEIAGRSIAEFSLAGFLFSYLLILLKDFQPVLIPGVIGVASISKRAHRVLHPSHVLLLAWTIVPLLVFNLSSARSARYVYPILPALALSGGWWLASVAPRFSRLLATRLVPVGVVAVALVLTVSPNLLTRDLNQTVKQSASQLKQRISEGPPVPYWGERYWEIANPLSLLRRETPGPTSADSAGRTRCRLEASGRTAGR